MIITLTPNPSLDRALVLIELVRGRLNRASEAKVDPGGKGVNASVALAANWFATTAVLPAGGFDGEYLAQLLRDANVELALVPIESGVRSNITLVENGGVSTKVNAPGPSLTVTELGALHETTVKLSEGASWVVACGSLPRDADPSLYADLVEGVRCRIAVDTTGAALMRAVDAGVDLIKPNLTELAEATETSPTTLGDVVEIAETLRTRGAGEVVVSLGRFGAVSIGESTVFGECVIDSVVSSVGAGDALLAGYVAEAGDQMQRLKRGLAWAAASCETPNTEMPTPDRIAQQTVTVTQVFDPAMPVV